MKTTFDKTLKHAPVNPDMNIGIWQHDSRLLGSVGTKL